MIASHLRLSLDILAILEGGGSRTALAIYEELRDLDWWYKLVLPFFRPALYEALEALEVTGLLIKQTKNDFTGATIVTYRANPAHGMTSAASA